MDHINHAKNNNLMIYYAKTDNLLNDIQNIIDTSQQTARQAVNVALIQRNWLLGYRIAEEILGGEERADYGTGIVKKLSKELTDIYGKGFTKTNLYSFYSFYKCFPQIFHSVSGKSNLLSWTHYRTLLQVEDSAAREWYAREASEQTWSVRTLQRNISSQYYYRLLKSQQKESVDQEMKQLTDGMNDKLEFIKNPVIAEFLGFNEDNSFTESDLEKSIITNLQKFLMELGKGYAFVSRSSVFILKKRTIGIVLCSDTDEDIARYPILHGNEQLFATKYKLYLPTEEELRAEIEAQKVMFYLQQEDKNDI